MTTFAKKANPRIVAAEIFSSSVCNLNCSYCYIPKNQKMIDEHNKILEAIRNNTFIKVLQDTYGEHLEYLGLWGAEQTLILHELEPFIEDFINTFPELQEISFSTNFVVFPERIISFIKKLIDIANKKERSINFSLQISIDGPDWITDIGRGKGVTDKIIKNIDIYMNELKILQSEKVTTSITFKPTVGPESIKILSEDENKTIEFFSFFNKLNNTLSSHIQEINGIKVYGRGHGTPTLVVPGKYTVEDGKILEKFYKQLRKLNKDLKEGKQNFLNYKVDTLNEYTSRLMNTINNMDTFKTNSANTTCSAFDTQYGIEFDGTVVGCHRMFLFNNDDYIKTIMESNIENWEISKMSKGIMKNIKKHLLPNINNNKDIAKYSYVTRGYHDFTKFRVSATFSMIQELAAAGQANSIYLENDDIAFLLAVYLNTQHTCPVENYLNSGSLHLSSVSMIRLFANGAFEEILEEYFDIIDSTGEQNE